MADLLTHTAERTGGHLCTSYAVVPAPNGAWVHLEMASGARSARFAIPAQDLPRLVTELSRAHEALSRGQRR